MDRIQGLITSPIFEQGGPNARNHVTLTRISTHLHFLNFTSAPYLIFDVSLGSLASCYISGISMGLLTSAEFVSLICSFLNAGLPQLCPFLMA